MEIKQHLVVTWILHICKNYCLCSFFMFSNRYLRKNTQTLTQIIVLIPAFFLFNNVSHACVAIVYMCAWRTMEHELSTQSKSDSRIEVEILMNTTNLIFTLSYGVRGAWCGLLMIAFHFQSHFNKITTSKSSIKRMILMDIPIMIMMHCSDC